MFEMFTSVSWKMIVSYCSVLWSNSISSSTGYLEVYPALSQKQQSTIVFWIFNQFCATTNCAWTVWTCWTGSNLMNKLQVA